MCDYFSQHDLKLIHCSHNLNEMDFLLGADLRSLGIFDASGRDVGFHRLKS